MTETYYDVLGVAEDASRSDIEAAYRERLKETHPDVSDDDDAQTATQRLVEARDVLVDTEERAEYDRVGHAAYVGEDSQTDTAPESDAATAARRAGYGEATDRSGGEPSEDRASTSDASAHTGRERADRERRASERVSRNRNGSRGSGTTGGTASASAAGSSGASRTAGQSTQYSVRQEYDVVERPEELLPSGRALTVLGLSFAFYPVLLASAVFPRSRCG
ncbi:J domain-containing protein [Halomicroarcula sp. GCM10025709]|uniref:J domain-containing protein n=1 Tax=Halomicroarcula sp. GCM10025709 TaxID=3252669 RepID=UPI0036124020